MSFFKKQFLIRLSFFAVLAFGLLLLGVCAHGESYNDVKQNDWYYNDVEYMTSKGFVKGYPDGSFMPHKSITRAEFIVLLARIFEYHEEGGNYFSDTFLDSSRKLLWYNGKISAALENNIIYKDDYNDAFLPEQDISRRSAAIFVYRALKLGASAFASPYADCNDSYINALYWENIMHGTDDGTQILFDPQAPLTRAQSCALLKRVYEYKTDKELYLYNYKELYGHRTPLLPLNPQSRQEFFDILVYCARAQLSQISFDYQGVGFYDVQNDLIQSNIFEAYRLASAAYPELFSLVGVECTKYGNSTATQITLTLKSNCESLSLMDIYARSKVAKDYAEYLAQNIFNVYESDGQKLEAIHDFLVMNCSYTENTENEQCYTAYGALLEQKAVCQGYSAAFNLISQACGIKSISVQNSTHAWNAAIVDGKTLHYDCTWDDPLTDGKDSGSVFKNYCGLSNSKITQSRLWDKDLYKTQLFDGVGF